jgi:hypothetical protein
MRPRLVRSFVPNRASVPARIKSRARTPVISSDLITNPLVKVECLLRQDGVRYRRSVARVMDPAWATRRGRAHNPAREPSNLLHDFPQRIGESCVVVNIIVIIMKYRNCRFGVIKRKEFVLLWIERR